MTRTNDPGGPLRKIRYKVEVYEVPVRSGEDDRLLSSTEVENLISGMPEALSRFGGGLRREMHPLKVKFTCLAGDPTTVGDVMVAFRMRRPVARANIQD